MPQRRRSGRPGRERGGPAATDDEVRRILAGSEKIYYRIGEVSQLTGVKAHVLRYWETEFRWMTPPKSRSKQRLYRKRDIEFVLLLKRLLWEERYTIAGARQRIQELGVDDALALLDEPGPTAAADGRRAGSGHAVRPAAADDASSTPAGLAATLSAMHAELSSLRSLLQDGA